MKASDLRQEDFIKWRRSLGMSQKTAANKLGISWSSVVNYERGSREGGRPVSIPVLVSWGMAAISANLQPYKGERDDNHNTGKNDAGPDSH